MKIAAILVLYNFDKKEILDNIQTYYNYVDKIYIIDNSEVKTNIFEFDKKYKYIKLENNFGIATALNIGLHCAIKDGYKWALTMDQDSKFYTSLDGYKGFIKNENTNNIIIIAPQYKLPNTRVNFQNFTKFLNEVWQSGNLINLELFKYVGDFLDKFFIDYVDYEYCYRAREKLGPCIIQCNSVILEHNPGVESTGSIFLYKYKYQSSSPYRFYYQIRNGLYVVYKYKAYKRLWYMFKGLAKVILLENNKYTKIKYMLKGIEDFMKSNYKTI